MTVNFNCPSCKTEMRRTGDRLACPRCAFAGRALEGGYLFDESDWYFGVTPREALRECLARAEEVGWRAAVDEVIGREKPQWAANISDDTRADWRHLLDLGPEKDILDAGAGYGTLSFAIANDVRSVWPTEKARERFDFMRLRARQDGIKNAFPVCADVFAMPYAPGSFDAVIVMGVLEWLGVTREGRPREIQMEFLRRVHELLRPAGQILMGIENRFGLALLRGAKDHSQLRYTSLMPRLMADAAVNRARRRFQSRMHTPAKGAGYRTYTYGPFALRRLLRQAGFQRVRLYSALPSYHQPHILVPVMSSQGMRRFLANPGLARDRGWVVRLRNLGLGRLEAVMRRYLSSDFIVVAEKEG